MFFPFLKYKKIYFIFSGVLMLASIILLIIFGINPGIEFTGGSILEVEFQEQRPSNQEIRGKLGHLELGEILVQPTGERGLILRMAEIDVGTHQQVLDALGRGTFEELRFESIGPVIGRELKQRTRTLIILALIAILSYVAFAFRKLVSPRRPWQYGIIGIIALLHDVLIPLGVFVFLGHFLGIPFTVPVVVALLTIVGYSINDTVVVFDRIRENLFKMGDESFERVVDFSLNQTLVRSVNTSLTTLLVLFAIFFFGGETLKFFALAFILGIIAGTYSSIFLAAPLLASWTGPQLGFLQRFKK